MLLLIIFSPFFFFNDTATTEIYTLSLHDALPICRTPDPADATGLLDRVRQLVGEQVLPGGRARTVLAVGEEDVGTGGDRKSTRLNSSHGYISYAVFCLKKKKKNKQRIEYTE